MTLVSNNQIEGMDRNIQLRSLLIEFLIPGGENGISTEEVNGHPLDRADVDESMTGIRVRQVRLDNTFGSNFSSSSKSPV